MNNVKLSPPWITFLHEIEALFVEDPEVRVEWDEESCVISLLVDNHVKADAIETLLPSTRTFGSVVVHIRVVPCNDENASITALYCRAFENNPIFHGVRGSRLDGLNYAMFRNEVVQFFNDNLHDAYGNESTLYQEIAKDVFGEDDGVFFCTDVPEKK